MSTMKIPAEKLKVTSDTHWGHEAVIGNCKRPFTSVTEMDEQLIANWNAAVEPDDIVVHVGDFSFHKPAKTEEIVQRLNGKIILVEGNHDTHLLDKYPKIALLFAGVHKMLEVRVYTHGVADPQRITFCHYSMRIWNHSHHGAYHIYGHSHGSLADDPHALSMDGGCDARADRLADLDTRTMGPPLLSAADYRPINFTEIQQHMSTKTWKSVDHHGIRAGDDGKIY